MAKKNRLYCCHFIEAGFPNECCLSCHEDNEEFGYEMLYLEPDGKSNVDAHICCGMSRVIDASGVSLRTIFTRALLAHRKESRDNQ